ncbi:MAG: protein YgfX [Gammaproteobacteria bacterium]|nr:protein YgfX [Gammaproteobacteria bacterium]
MIQDNSFMQAIRLPVNEGPWAVLYLITIHGGAVVLLFATGMPWQLQLLCCVAVTVHAGHMLAQYSPRFSRELPRELLLTPAGDWWLTDGDGNACRAVLKPDAFISPPLVVLRFQVETGIRRAVIVADEYNTDMLRRLRVRLLNDVNRES